MRKMKGRTEGESVETSESNRSNMSMMMEAMIKKKSGKVPFIIDMVCMLLVIIIVVVSTTLIIVGR